MSHFRVHDALPSGNTISSNAILRIRLVFLTSVSYYLITTLIQNINSASRSLSLDLRTTKMITVVTYSKCPEFLLHANFSSACRMHSFHILRFCNCYSVILPRKLLVCNNPIPVPIF